MKKILFLSLLIIFIVGFTEPAFALQHWAGEVVKDVIKNCEKDYDKKDCERSCNLLGATDDKWDVALREKTLCIEIVCKEHKNGTRTVEREIYGQKQEYEVFTPCGVLCDNINDQHYLCVEEKTAKYCQGNGYDKDKCKKYCDKGSNKNSLCSGFVNKNTGKKEINAEPREIPKEETPDNIEPDLAKTEDIKNENLQKETPIQEEDGTNILAAYNNNPQKNDPGLLEIIITGFKGLIKKIFSWN